jgi:hypothetical protein
MSGMYIYMQKNLPEVIEIPIDPRRINKKIANTEEEISGWLI